MGEENATSSDHGDDTEPVTPNPNRVGTRTTNTKQHPGVLHNIYTAKRRTKPELIEARRIEAEKKAAKAEEAERQATKHADSMRRVADYEKGLGRMDVDKTPLSQPLHPLRPLHRTYALLDMIEASVAGNGGEDSDVAPEPMEVEFAERGEDDERNSARFVEESEATNQNDKDYVEDEDDDDDDESLYLAIDQMKAGVAARTEKRKQGATKIAEARDDGDARPTKKAKGSASVDPGGKLEPPAKSLKVGGDSKKKEKPGVLLRGALTALRSGAQEQNQDKGGDARGDTRGDTRGDDLPKR
jgi:hypothetical protein